MRSLRRWFRYSLRTVFVVLTVLGVWLGSQVNWIRERREYIVAHGRFGVGDPFAESASESSPRAPNLLWLLGEEGIDSLEISTTRLSGGEIPPEAAKARRLFPEAALWIEARNGGLHL